MSEIKRQMVSHLLKEAPGNEVLAKGWVRTKRGNKNVAFIALNDGSSVNNIQVVCDTNNFSEELLKDVLKKEVKEEKPKINNIKKETKLSDLRLPVITKPFFGIMNS